MNSEEMANNVIDLGEWYDGMVTTDNYNQKRRYISACKKQCNLATAMWLPDWEPDTPTWYYGGRDYWWYRELKDAELATGQGIACWLPRHEPLVKWPDGWIEQNPLIEKIRSIYSAIAILENRIKYQNLELIDAMTGLRDRLTRDIGHLKDCPLTETDDFPINSLGQVQGLGNRIDNLTGKLSEAHQTLKLLTAFLLCK